MLEVGGGATVVVVVVVEVLVVGLAVVVLAVVIIGEWLVPESMKAETVAAAGPCPVQIERKVKIIENKILQLKKFH